MTTTTTDHAILTHIEAMKVITETRDVGDHEARQALRREAMALLEVLGAVAH